jgi:hypothetical protein
MGVAMKQKRISRFCAGLILALAVLALVGCKGSQATPAAASRSLGTTYTSQVLDASYSGALNASSQLMLGMLRLEGTDNAITSEQATALLPVAQSLQGQVLKSDAERNAVLAYIEAHLTPAQSGAIANMHLTQDDLQTWTRDSGPGAGFGPGQGGAGPQGTPGAVPGQSGAGLQGTPGARPGQGGVRPQGTPGARRSFGAAAGGAGAVSGQSNILLNALIRLLAQKSGVATSSSGSRTINQTPTAPQPTNVSTPTPLPTAGPTTTSTVTTTATLTPTATRRAVSVSTQPPASGAPLDFTQDNIEYAPSAPRTGDRKIQLTIRLKLKGGTPPFSLLLDGATQVDGLTYTFDWHNCGESEPHSVVVLSADGQKSKPVEFIYPYECR